MFEKITDFDGKQFLNLWGGFSCVCFVDGINTFVTFYVKDKEVLSLSGNDANDILDFVLSKYYENENSTIEDGFSTWLIEHYDNVKPPFDGVGTKFQRGEWIASKGLNTARIISNDGDRYEVEFIDGNKGFPHIDYVDRNFHLWSIADAKEGDVLTLSYMYQNYIFIYKGLNEKSFQTMMSIFCSYYVEEDAYEDETDSFHTMNTGEIITPATKEQRDTLFTKMKEAGYEWDTEKKELKEIVRQNTTNKVKSKENKSHCDIGNVLCTTFDKETEIEDTLTTDDIPLSVLFKILLKDWKHQNRIIKKQKKEIKKLKDKINELSSSV